MRPASLAADNGWALHYQSTRREANAREGGRYSRVHRVSSPEPLGLRTHKLQDWSLPLGSAVVEYQVSLLPLDSNFARGPVCKAGNRDTLPY